MPRKVVPEKLKLYAYQKEGVRTLASRRKSLLADQMGLGKTPQAIVCSNIWSTQRMVVICPAVVRSTWETEVAAWDTLGRKCTLVQSGKQSVERDTNIIIISYTLAATKKWKDFLISYLKSDTESLLICDEAHSLKSWTANRTRTIIIDVAPSAGRLMLLTGTPMTKSIADLHPLLCAIMPGKWGKLADFCYRYSYPFPTGFGNGIEYRGTRNIPELKERIKPYMVRRFKQDVLKDLPPKTFSNVLLDIDAAVAEKSLKLVDYVMKKLESDGSLPDTLGDGEHIATVKRDLGVAKLKPIFAWLDNYLETNPDEPLVIFAYHKIIVAALHEYFTKRNVSACTITGSTNHKDRADAVDGFQSGKYQVFIGNIIAAGVGITLTRASTCIMAELDWTPANVSQAVDRLHRITQVNPVLVYFLLAKDSLDDHIVDILKTKMNDINKTVGKEIADNKGETNDTK